MPERHESCCAVYNMPAYPNGPCDCKFKEQNESFVTPPKKTRKVKGNIVKRSRHLDPEALDKAVEAIRMSDQ
jgi:hypothetical protein